MNYIAVFDEYRAIGKTLEEAYEGLREYDYDLNLKDFTFYEAKELEVKQEFKVIEVSTIKKVK